MASVRASKLQTKQRRLSLSERDAVHAYEWLVMYWHGDDTHQPFGGCALCQTVGKRLEKFIGTQNVRRVKKSVRANPINRTADGNR